MMASSGALQWFMRLLQVLKHDPWQHGIGDGIRSSASAQQGASAFWRPGSTSTPSYGCFGRGPPPPTGSQGTERAEQLQWQDALLRVAGVGAPGSRSARPSGVECSAARMEYPAARTRCLPVVLTDAPTDSAATESRSGSARRYDSLGRFRQGPIAAMATASAPAPAPAPALTSHPGGFQFIERIDPSGYLQSKPVFQNAHALAHAPALAAASASAAAGRREPRAGRSPGRAAETAHTQPEGGQHPPSRR